MTKNLTVESLFELIRHRFNVSWAAGRRGIQRTIITNASWGSHPKIIGHLNLINPYRVQVIGKMENRFLQDLSPEARHDVLKKLFGGITFAVIVADNEETADELRDYAEASNIALFNSTASSNEMITDLRYRLSTLLASKVTIHGVFMEVISLGVLLTGESSIGKSELALELITRGHRLVADDAPEFARITPDTISGSCPSLLQDLLEVRGLGVLNVREMYGDGAIKNNKYLRLMIKLLSAESDALNQINRLSNNNDVRNILGVDIPEISLHVAPGRNLAVMIEAAVQNHLINLRGYDANEEITQRQQMLFAN